MSVEGISIELVRCPTLIGCPPCYQNVLASWKTRIRPARCSGVKLQTSLDSAAGRSMSAPGFPAGRSMPATGFAPINFRFFAQLKALDAAPTSAVAVAVACAFVGSLKPAIDVIGCHRINDRLGANEV